MTKGSAMVAGSGGIAFAVLFVGALVAASPPGGMYNASEIAAYVAPAHVVAAGLGWVLGILSVAGLVCLLAYLRQAAEASTGVSPWVPRVVWGLGLAGAACFGVGWGIVVAQPIAHAEAGTTITLPPMVTYVIVELSSTILFGSAPMLVGLALIALGFGARDVLPAWLRWLSIVVGVLAITSLAFFTFFPLLLWSVIIGAWLLITGGKPAPAT
jgi:hypothetical protein